MDFIEMVKDLQIKTGDYFTVARWRGSDRSWIGDVFLVKAVDLPFVRAVAIDGAMKGKGKTFNIGEVELKPLDPAFVQAVLDTE